LTLSYFAVSVTMSHHFAQMSDRSSSQTVCTATGNDTSSLTLFVQLSSYTSTSIPSKLGTKLWSVLLTVSFCTVVFNFPLHLRHLSLRHQT
jgi:hypothetical protein